MLLVKTKQTPLLEELTGKGNPPPHLSSNKMLTSSIVRGRTLSRRIPRSHRLKHLELWNGAAVEGNGDLIRLHCHSLKRQDFWDYSSILLHILPWTITLISHRKERNSGQGLAAFLNELRPQSLEWFVTVSKIEFGPQCFQALSCHGESLVELKLDMLTPDTIPKFSLLKCCTNLVSLSLGEARGAQVISK